MKRFISRLVIGFTILVSSQVQAACSVHDQTCRYHSIGSQSAHIGKQQVHHIKGVQSTPSIEASDNGLYLIAEWADNNSGQQADIDIDVLLPNAVFDNAGGVQGGGPFVVSNNAAMGGAPASSDPFDGVAGEHDRHVNTYQYQITFSGNTTTAIHSKDANGIAPIPNAKDCITKDSYDSCEHVQIAGNIPDAVYEAALTNFDIHGLSDPSTPQYNIWAHHKNDPNKPNEIDGEIYYLDQASELSGSMTQTGETSGRFRVGFQNRDFDPHAEGVVFDDFQTRHNSKLKYGNTYQHMQGNYLTTLQDTYRDHWKINRRETINAKGIVDNKENLGVVKGSYQKDVYAGTNLVNRQYIPPPPKLQLVQDELPLGLKLTLAPNSSIVSGSELIFSDPSKSIMEKGMTNTLYTGCYSKGSTKGSCFKATLKVGLDSFAYEVTNFSLASGVELASAAGLDGQVSTIATRSGLYNKNKLSSNIGTNVVAYNPSGLVKNGIKRTVSKLQDRKTDVAKKVYHYTDEAGAKAIGKTGVIKTDSMGRVFVTQDKVPASEANNALFMGRGGTKGTHRVEIKLKGDVNLNHGTQPNELIHYGAIRDPRQGLFKVEENDF